MAASDSLPAGYPLPGSSPVIGRLAPAPIRRRRTGEGLPSSRRHLPHVPRPLRREVLRGCASRLFTPSMAFALTAGARLLLVPTMRWVCSRRGRLRFMLRTAWSLPLKGFRHRAPARPVSRPDRRSATGPPGSYPDRTLTGRRRRACLRTDQIILHRPSTSGRTPALIETGKAERFIQILQNEWAYARPYRSNAERLHQLPRWLYRYNVRRPHGGIGGAVPASRL